MKTQIKRVSLLILVIAFLPLGVYAQSKTSIPANFTTYTDEVCLFRISYPTVKKCVISRPDPQS